MTRSTLNALLKAIAKTVIVMGKQTKRPWIKKATGPWHQDFNIAKKRMAQDIRDNAKKRLHTMRYSALRKDGTVFHLTRNWLRGPLRPVQKHPDPDVAHYPLTDFSGNPPYDLSTILKLPIMEYIRKVHLDDDPPSFCEFKKACQGKPKKAVGLDGVPLRLLGMLCDGHLNILYQGVRAIWTIGDIPEHWLRSEVVLMCKKGGPCLARELPTHCRHQ